MCFSDKNGKWMTFIVIILWKLGEKAKKHSCNFQFKKKCVYNFRIQRWYILSYMRCVYQKLFWKIYLQEQFSGELFINWQLGERIVVYLPSEILLNHEKEYILQKKWVELEAIMISEISLSWKEKYLVFSDLVTNIQSIKNAYEQNWLIEICYLQPLHSRDSAFFPTFSCWIIYLVGIQACDCKEIGSISL